MHEGVTILFTDIVGFTAMAQTCLPFQVMHFLHALFSGFDDLIEMDSHLFKVETIGDAFMVASGLGNMEDENRSQTVVSMSASTSNVKAEKHFLIKEAFNDSLRATRAVNHR